MSLSLFFFLGAAFFMALVVGAGIYLGKRGVFKKAADAGTQAAVQAVTQDAQNLASKVEPPK